MKLKTLINVLTSSSRGGGYNLVWKDEQDLQNQIENLIVSFSDSSEPLTPAKSITHVILTRFGDRIGAYDGMQIDLASFENLKLNPEINDAVIGALNSIITKEDSKKGNFSLTLNEDEIYGLFSLAEFRKSKLDEIL